MKVRKGASRGIQREHELITEHRRWKYWQCTLKAGVKYKHTLEGQAQNAILGYAWLDLVAHKTASANWGFGLQILQSSQTLQLFQVFQLCSSAALPVSTETIAITAATTCLLHLLLHFLLHFLVHFWYACYYTFWYTFCTLFTTFLLHFLVHFLVHFFVTLLLHYYYTFCYVKAYHSKYIKKCRKSVGKENSEKCI